MAKENAYQNKNVLVLGLAKSGYYAAKLLHELGARVTVNDAQDLSENTDALELDGLGIRIIAGGHPDDLLDEIFDVIVKNPGIPYQNSIIIQASKKKHSGNHGSRSCHFGNGSLFDWTYRNEW